MIIYGADIGADKSSEELAMQTPFGLEEGPPERVTQCIDEGESYEGTSRLLRSRTALGLSALRRARTCGGHWAATGDLRAARITLTRCSPTR
jgi:hypothetical protein